LALTRGEWLRNGLVMLVLRILVVVGWLGVLAFGAGCPSPLPDVVAGGNGESDGVETGGVETGEVEAGDLETGEEEPACGNGIVEPGENCDDEGESATCDVDCTPVDCGDGVVNVAAGEECDGDDLGAGTCEGLGFDTGVLACGGECNYDVSECYVLPGVPVLGLSFSQVKQFDFEWELVAGADFYRIEESVAPGEPFVQVGSDIVGGAVSHEVPLYLRWDASYRLLACNGGGCNDSAMVSVLDSLVDAVGYVKAFNTGSGGSGDRFGESVALSTDGTTLAVGALYEDSSALGIGGNEADDAANNAGAVYIYVREGMGTWSQQAYVKASNTDSGDRFGESVALSGDGTTLVVGAPFEDSSALGIEGDEADNSADNAGAVYVYVREGIGTWSQQAYVKASNTDSADSFGNSVALSGDGITLAVGALYEDSSALGIGGNEADDSTENAGAVYVYVRDGMGTWSHQAYVKASNTDSGDRFGHNVTLSGDGTILAVGAPNEDGSAQGIGGDEADDSASNAGAVYVYVRDGMGTWSQREYVKASNTDSGDYFGHSVALGEDGSTLAVGAPFEGSSALGIGGDEADDSAGASGAVYVYVQDGMGSWSQQAYVKASNTDSVDYFGYSVGLSGDGTILAVGAPYEDSSAQGIGGNEADDAANNAGAVYMYVRGGMGTWSQQAYVKASNTDSEDRFGYRVALSGDGTTLAVGAYGEDSSSTGIGSDEADDSASNAGAVYLY